MARGLLARAIAQQRSGDFGKALILCQEALQLDATLARAWNCLGVCHQGQGNEEKSIECYMRAIESNPRLLRPWANLGNRYRDRGAIRASLSCYLEATSLDAPEPGDNEIKSDALKALDRQDEQAPLSGRRRVL